MKLLTKQLRFHHPKSDGSGYYDCPWCKGKGKLEVHHTRPVFRCHKCSRSGKVGDLRRREFIQPLGETEDLSKYRPAERDSAVVGYLKGRSLTDKAISDLRPHTGPSMFRAYFPLYGLGESQPCFFLARIILSSGGRYSVPSRETSLRGKSQLLWGVHRLNGRKERIVLCEGIFDAVHHGGGLALMGKTLSSDQAKLLTRIAMTELILFLDGGVKLDQVIPKLRSIECPVYRIPLPPGTDPDRKARNLTPWLRRKERLW